MEEKISGREAAFLTLEKILTAKGYSNIELDSAIKKYALEGAEKSLCAALVYGTAERSVTIDYYIGAYSRIPLEKTEPAVLTALRMGIYQILYLDIPDHAACYETVELVKKHSHKGADKFVNAILRNIIRNKDSLPCPKEDDENYLSVKYSCPKTVTDIFVRDYGREKAEEILSAFFTHPRMTLRVNTLKTTRDELEKSLPCVKTTRSEDGLILTESIPVSSFDELNNGLCFVQDEASQICAAAVGAMPGETVVDTCSCPGGKSFSMAINMKNEGRIYSLDLHKNKLSLVEKGAERLGISIIETRECDGRKGDEALFGIADRVLCDVPCSGLGVIAKKPEIRFKSKDEIDRLPPIQLEILEKSKNYLKESGTLVYSTCTLNKNENGCVVFEFLKRNKDFTLEKDETVFPDGDRDGFYYAVMKRG